MSSVLVVEDEPDLARLVSDYLTRTSDWHLFG